MPLPPASLTNCATEPAVPAGNASDMTLAIFMANEHAAWLSCFTSLQTLTDWISTTAAGINAVNQSVSKPGTTPSATPPGKPTTLNQPPTS